MSKLRDSTIEAVDQLRSLIIVVRSAALPSENLYAEAGIGRHVRHVLDHFRAFEAGVNNGLIDYNVRNRESRVERRADMGLFEIQKLIRWLETVVIADAGVSVESEISCVETVSQRFESNFKRELLYLINHTVHHTAYASLIARQHSIVPDVVAGFAPATISYMRQNRTESG